MIEPKVMRVADSVFRHFVESQLISVEYSKDFMLTEIMRSKSGDWVLLLEHDPMYDLRHAPQSDDVAPGRVSAPGDDR